MKRIPMTVTEIQKLRELGFPLPEVESITRWTLLVEVEDHLGDFVRRFLASERDKVGSLTMIDLRIIRGFDGFCICHLPTGKWKSLETKLIHLNMISADALMFWDCLARELWEQQGEWLKAFFPLTRKEK